MSNTENRLIAAIAACEKGDGVTTFSLFTLLAQEEIALGQHYLAWCYEQGIGVARDPIAAFDLWSKSALAGIPESLHALGHMYANGYGTEKDIVKAYYWYFKAASTGDEEARTGVEKLREIMSPAEMLKAGELINEV